MQDVIVLTGPPGCGKSDQLRIDAIRDGGLYLFCLPTIPLIEEQVARLASEAPDVPVYRADYKHGRGSVQRQLDDALEQIAANGAKTAFVFSTHETLISRDLSRFTGWHIRIDEAPHAVRSGAIAMRQSRPFFEAKFDLLPFGNTGWSRLTPIGGHTSWVEWSKDDVAKPFLDFLKLACGSSEVFVRGAAWAEIETLEWWSLWAPTSLKGFASVQVAGASYRQSLGALIAEKYLGDHVNFVERPVPYTRSGRPVIRIYYFTSGHMPSTTLWASSEGRRRIKAVCDYLAANVRDLGYWSGNDEVLTLMEWRLAGDMVLPKVVGQNRWRTETKCAFIYSSKAVPSDAIVQDTFDISDAEIRRSREDEDVLQFVMRGAVRNPDFDGQYDIYLYSQDQAEALKRLLDISGLGRSISLVPVYNAGIMDISDEQRSVARRPAARGRNTSQSALRVRSPSGGMILPKSLKRRQKRAEMARNLPPKKRGRPPNTKPKRGSYNVK